MHSSTHPSRIVGLDGNPLDPAAAGPQQSAWLPAPGPAERVKVATARPSAPRTGKPAPQAPLPFEPGAFPIGKRRLAEREEWCAAVAELHGLSILEAFSLTVLARGAAQTGEARMSVAYLAKHTRATERGIRKALRRLEAAGIIASNEGRGRLGHRATRYRFRAVDNSRPGGNSVPPRGELSSAQGGTQFRPSEASSEASYRSKGRYSAAEEREKTSAAWYARVDRQPAWQPDTPAERERYKAAAARHLPKFRAAMDTNRNA